MTGKSTGNRRQQSIITMVTLVVLAILYLLAGKIGCRKEPLDKREKEFRHNSIAYTKHARCRMDCRQIDEQEVKEIVQNGKINYSNWKSGCIV